MDKLDNELSFGTKCRIAGIRRDTAKYYRKAHPELTDDEVIMHYVNKEKTFRDKCREAGICTNYGEKYKYMHRELTEDEVIQCILINRSSKTSSNKTSTSYISRKHKEELKKHKEELKKHREELKKLCNGIGVNYDYIRDYRRRYPNLTDEEIIYKIKINRGKVSFSKKCSTAGVSYNGARHYRKRHPELTDEQVIEIYKTKENRIIRPKVKGEKSFRQKCIDSGVEYSRARHYKRRHLDLDDDTIINLYKMHNNRLVISEEDSKNKCKKANIDRKKFTDYRRLHPELTEEQIIVYFNPKCYINILGELVIPD